MKVSAKKARKWARNRTTVMPDLTATAPTGAPVVQKPTENMSLLEKLKAKRTSMQTPSQSPTSDPVSEPQPVMQMIQTPKRLKKARMTKAQIAAKYGAMMNVKPEKTNRPNKPLYAAAPKAIQYADWGERFGARAKPRHDLIYKKYGEYTLGSFDLKMAVIKLARIFFGTSET